MLALRELFGKRSHLNIFLPELLFAAHAFSAIYFDCSALSASYYF